MTGGWGIVHRAASPPRRHSGQFFLLFPSILSSVIFLLVFLFASAGCQFCIPSISSGLITKISTIVCLPDGAASYFAPRYLSRDLDRTKGVAGRE